MTELIEVLIPRDEWVRGGCDAEFGETYLRNDLGNKCCLGHMGAACGVSDDEMDGVQYPGELIAFHKYPADLDVFALTFIAINDYRDIPDDIREEWIAEGFRRVGCEAVFVDTRAEATE